MTTKHDNHCNMAFGRKDPTCARCQELLQGAAPRRGWGALKKENERKFTTYLAAHNCKERRCGPVCTVGEW